MTLHNAPPSLRGWSTTPVVVVLLLFAAIVLAWANTWNAPFVFDDVASIVENRSIRELGSLAWLNPPHAAGETVSGRPVLNFTFALNYAISGLNVWSYHLLNWLIHASAALVLWAVLRRLPAIGRGVAFVTALLWALHPLQTAAVSYVVQRAESLAALCTLLTVYGFVRYAGGEDRRTRWAVLSVVAGLAGVGTKETAAVAPLLVILIGGTCCAASFREAWQKYHRLYLALFSTWLVLGALVWANHGRGGSAGLSAGISVASYALTQTWAIVRYLRLAVWPVGQVFDYGMVVAADPASVLGPCALLGVLLVATVWGLWRRHAASVAGAAFFLLLAPSSSIVPVATQTIAEHRMYLALAPVIALALAGGAAALRRCRAPAGLAAGLAAVVALGLLGATVARNAVFRSELALWQDTAAKRPGNPRAQHNLGLALLAAGRTDEAITAFRRAIALQPNHALAHFSLGAQLARQGELDDAVAHFRTALAADPHYVNARVNLAQALAQLGRTDEAMAENRAVLAEEPSAQDARTNLAALLIARDPGEAIRLLTEVLAAAPELAEAHFHLGRALEKSGAAGAEAEFRVALRLKPDFAVAQLALGNVLARGGDGTGAEGAYREAIRLDARLAEARFALGNVLARKRDFGAAIEFFQAALAIDPSHVQARNNLANCQLVTGRVREAVATYEEVLRRRPGDEAVRKNLELARELLGGSASRP